MRTERKMMKNKERGRRRESDNEKKEWLTRGRKEKGDVAVKKGKIGKREKECNRVERRDEEETEEKFEKEQQEGEKEEKKEQKNRGEKNGEEEIEE